MFLADITRAVIGQGQLSARAFFPRNAHWPIMDYTKLVCFFSSEPFC